MASEKKQIVFAPSMTADKRNADFAYLRKNAFPSRTPGLYPSRDFYQEAPEYTGIPLDGLFDPDDEIVDVLGSEEVSPSGQNYKIFVIINRNGDTMWFQLGSNSVNPTYISGDYECGAFGGDGVYVCCDGDVIKRLNHTNTNASTIGTSLTEAVPRIAANDGLYYWWISSNEIYKQLAGQTATVAFNDLGFTPRFVDFLNDQMVIFGETAGGIIVVFWDKSDTDLFDKRIFIPNARLVAAGNVNGRLMLVKGIGNSANTKERNGEIVVCGYDGEKFVRMNSIKAGQKDTRYEDETGMDTGSEVMLFSVRDNTSSSHPELFKNYIYKVMSDGSIEVQYEPDIASLGDVHIVRVFYNFTLYAHRGTGSTRPSVWINEATGTEYDDYEGYTTTEYITDFMCAPYNLHKLDGLLVAFEKLFGETDDAENPTTGEQLDVYYRVSDRDGFTLLGTITPLAVKENVNQRRDQSEEYGSGTDGLPEQRYVFTKMPNGDPLPEFNEIQFWFVSKRGFTIADAWFSYSYLTRNTLP